MAHIDYATKVQTLRGDDTDLSDHEGKVLLIVNTASKCGFTPQYEGLEKLHQQLEADGLQVLGFPCNQFGKQEPGNAGEIEQFCQVNYGVSFPMHAKVDVNGAKTHPLFAQLKAGAPGLMGSKSIKWNFTKFLVGRDGTILGRYGSRTTPAQLRGDVEKALKS